MSGFDVGERALLRFLFPQYEETGQGLPVRTLECSTDELASRSSGSLLLYCSRVRIGPSTKQGVGPFPNSGSGPPVKVVGCYERCQLVNEVDGDV